MTLDQFISRYPIRLTSDLIDHNPNQPDNHQADHWKCVLRFQRRRMALYFSQGFGFGGRQPELKDVLDCLISDCHSTNLDFDEWCSDYGYNSDSRQVERIYKTCMKQAKAISRLLGSELYYVLLNCEDN